MDLTIDDVKALTFELFMSQRECAQLRQKLAELEQANTPAPTGDVGDIADRDN